MHPFKRVLNYESFELIKHIVFGIVAVINRNDIIRSVIRFRISVELLFDNLVPCGRRAIRLFFLATIHKEEVTFSPIRRNRRSHPRRGKTNLYTASQAWRLYLIVCRSSSQKVLRYFLRVYMYSFFCKRSIRFGSFIHQSLKARFDELHFGKPVLRQELVYLFGILSRYACTLNHILSFSFFLMLFFITLVFNRPISCHYSFLRGVNISNRIYTTEYILLYVKLFVKGLSAHNSTSLKISLYLTKDTFLKKFGV